MKKVIAYILLAVVALGYGCMGTTSISEKFTPTPIDQDAVETVVAAGTGRVSDYKGILFPSLAEARKLEIDLKAAIDVTDQELRHLAEKKHLKDQILTGSVRTNVNVGVQREEAIFNPNGGALAVGLGLLGIPAAGYLGMLRKRKGDISPEEQEAALAEIKGEVTQKDRAVIQLVTQIQKIIDIQPTKEAKDAMIKDLKEGQLPETRVEVKAALAKL